MEIFKSLFLIKRYIGEGRYINRGYIKRGRNIKRYKGGYFWERTRRNKRYKT